MHGLGADGNDFVPFVDELDLRTVGNVRFIFPHAPTRPVTINGGYIMRAWYDIRDFDLANRADLQGVDESVAQVEALIAREAERGIPPQRLLLAGFSQGGAITLREPELQALYRPAYFGTLFGVPIPIVVILAVTSVAAFILYRTRYGRHVVAVDHHIEQAGEPAGQQHVPRVA